MPVMFMPDRESDGPEKLNLSPCKKESQSTMSAFGFLSFVIAVVNVVISNINSNNNNNNNNINANNINNNNM